MNPTPSPAPQRLGATYPPYPFWAWTCSRNPEAAEDKGQWHRLTGPLPRGRSWPFYYWLPDQPEKPTCDPRTTPSPSAPQEVPQWAKDAANEIHPPVGLGRDADRREFIASIIARHAQPALSEENRRLRGEIDQIVMERDAFHDERDTLRLWSEQAREALERISKIPPRGQGDAVEMECIARNALLQSPAATNLTEERK